MCDLATGNTGDRPSLPTAASQFTATDGHAYDRQMGRWSRRLAEAFLDFTGPIAASETVLDVGCGTGVLARSVANRSQCGPICGIDASAAYLQQASQVTSDQRISFRVGDACALPFPPASFDRVLSLLLLHFVPNAPAAVLEMRRVGRPGAVIAAAVWDARGGGVAHRVFLDTAAALDPRAETLRARHCTRPMTRPGELGATWRASGLIAVVETTLTIRMEFAEFDDFWLPHLEGQGPAAAYVAGLAPADLTRLMSRVRSAYLDGESDGPRSYAAIAWAVRGVVPG